MNFYKYNFEMQLKIQAVREFPTVQVCTFKTTFRIGKMTAYGGSEFIDCWCISDEFQSWMVRGYM